MTGRHDFQDLTAHHLGLSIEKFYSWDKRAKDICCRDYLKELVLKHGNARGISQVVPISERGIYAIMKRYDVKTARQAKTKKRRMKQHE